MITGNRISSVSASRPTEEAITNMRFNINFDDVKVTGENVEVMYTFQAMYESGEKNDKKAGDLKIVGSVMAKESKAIIDEINSSWKEKKTLPIEFAEDLINLLNFECGSRGTLLAWSIGLVAPLPLSRAKLQKQEK